MKTRILAMTIILSLLFILNCSKDNNSTNSEQFGSISGIVTFTGTWPSTGDIQVSIWASWPPQGPPAEATDPLTQGQSKTFKIEGLSKGTYPVVTAGWRDPANPAGAKVLGIYWSKTDSIGVDTTGNVLSSVQPTPIVISDNKLNYSNIDIKANLDIAP
jgi:hypothetical protein